MAKRIFDILLAALAALVLLPMFAVLCVLIRVRLGSPIFFTQLRPGLAGRPFWMIKFRSMTDERDADGKLLPDAQRLPPFGRWLRATSLDELPELWNVLRGDMSLVGPRPLLMAYLPLYSPEQARRHCVRPGITGWAQINGRNSLSWNEKFALDTWYADNGTMLLDIYILFMTVWKVVRREGISAADDATMPIFRGNNEEPDPS